jgi:hypothetical protein
MDKLEAKSFMSLFCWWLRRNGQRWPEGGEEDMSQSLYHAAAVFPMKDKGKSQKSRWKR